MAGNIIDTIATVALMALLVGGVAWAALEWLLGGE
jgi:hypothetical protein